MLPSSLVSAFASPPPTFWSGAVRLTAPPRHTLFAQEKPTPFDNHTLEELEEQIPVLKNQIDELTNKRNYCQLERDTIDGFRTMTASEVDRLETKTKLRDLELEELVETHRVEQDVYAHKVRHLKYETDVDVTKVRGETDAIISENHGAYRAKVERSEKGKVAALGELEDQMEVAHDSVAHLMGHQDMELAQSTASHEKALADYQATCRERLRLLRENLETQRRVELQEIEDRKNGHLQALLSNHASAFAEMKGYYQGITADNCGLIKRYEEELAELRTNQLRNADLLKAAMEENERLREPLAVVMAEVAHLKGSLTEVDKIKLMLRNARGRLKDSGRKRDGARRDVERLKGRIATVEGKREALYKEFETTILALQGKTDRKNLMLAKRLDGYEAEAEGCEAKIEQMVAAMELDKGTVLDVLRHTSKAIAETDEARDATSFAIARGVKVYNETLAAFQDKMVKLGIPEAEARGIGFELLPEPVGGARTSPSGLVAAPFS